MYDMMILLDGLWNGVMEGCFQCCRCMFGDDSSLLRERVRQRWE